MATNRLLRVTSRQELTEPSFSYRTLDAARRILQAQYASAMEGPRKNQLQVQRLRRLKRYVESSITELEQTERNKAM